MGWGYEWIKAGRTEEEEAGVEMEKEEIKSWWLWGPL